MKRARELHVGSLFLLAVALVCGAVIASAQNRSEYVISAKAGQINFVSGSITVRREGTSAWRTLTVEDRLEAGDRVKTGSNGRFEVLLNPGSFVRVGESSEFELSSSSVAHPQLKVVAGSIVVEASIDAEQSIEIATPQTGVTLVRSGIYRINALAAANATEVFVRKGRALVGSSAVVVKAGKTITVRGGGATSEVAKFEGKNKDALDLWSRERASTLLENNRKLARNRDLNRALASFNSDDLFRYGRLGLWVYNPTLRCYWFLPFYSDLTSPYGFGYYSPFGYSYYSYPVGYRPGNGAVAGGGGNGGAVVGGGNPGSNSPMPSQPASSNPGMNSPSEMPRAPRMDMPDRGGMQRGIERPRDQ
ncbi:MAG: FecR domain-containing protein [Pyrinomonadaceae bacterium]|nr:FecR domain-containing protein [Pyrinomonadaceae bacterium]